MSVYAINRPYTDDLSLILRLILENSNFEFKSKVYKQMIEYGMGSNCFSIPICIWYPTTSYNQVSR